MPSLTREQLDEMHREIDRDRRREQGDVDREHAHLAAQERRRQARRANVARFAPWLKALAGLGLAALSIKALWG